MTITLVSDSGNHSPHKWAYAVARMILNVDFVADPLRHLSATVLQANAADAMAPHFLTVINREINNLKMFVDHCDTPYNVQEIAEQAVKDVQALAQSTPWSEHVTSPVWQSEAIATVGNNLASAIHLERLLHADHNPNNTSAVAYKLKHNGS